MMMRDAMRECNNVDAAREQRQPLSDTDPCESEWLCSFCNNIDATGLKFSQSALFSPISLSFFHSLHLFFVFFTVPLRLRSGLLACWLHRSLWAARDTQAKHTFTVTSMKFTSAVLMFPIELTSLTVKEKNFLHWRWFSINIARLVLSVEASVNVVNWLGQGSGVKKPKTDWKA